MAEFQLPSSESLRRSALTRSAQRNARVARRRIWWRWSVWLGGLALRWAVLPAVVVASLLWLFDRDNAADPGRGGPSAPSALPTTPAPAGASAPAKRGLQLRMDNSGEASPTAPRRRPQAQSDASPIVDDRSSRER